MVLTYLPYNRIIETFYRSSIASFDIDRVSASEDGESTRQVEGLFESLLAEAFS